MTLLMFISFCDSRSVEPITSARSTATISPFSWRVKSSRLLTISLARSVSK